MASRRRLGVAVVLDAPLADEINGLRRALGDRALERIAPHVTLVPPVNVRAGDLPEALAVLRRGAQACGRPLTLSLGPPGSFLPANPVVHLQVGGDVAELARLRESVFTGPLQRSSSWPWVPHVTLADDIDPLLVDAALTALAHYRAVAVVDRVVLLEERRGEAGRRWAPLADAALAPAVVVGRGGLDLTVVRGRVLDPQADALMEEAGCEPADGGDPIVVTGLVEGTVVGVAVARRRDAGGRIAVVVTPSRRRSGLGRQLLAHAEDAVRTAGWECPVLVASGPPGFYRSCSRWSVPPAPELRDPAFRRR